MANRTILLIDSDSEIAQDIVATLETEDYLVFMSSTADFAVVMAGKVKPALILANTALTGANSLDICKKLHDMEDLGSVPIIALGSLEGDMEPRYRSEYGIVDLLRTPFTHKELMAKIACALSAESADAEQEPVTSGPLKEAPGPEKIPEMNTGKSDRIVVRLKEKTEGEEQKEAVAEEVQIPEKEPEAAIPPVEGGEIASREAERPFVARRPMRRRRRSGSSVSLPLVVAAVLVILGAAVAVVYRMGLLPGAEVKRAVLVEPPQPAQKEAVQESPATEQKPQQEVTQDKALPSALPSALPPPAAVQPSERKTAGKALYSVQIGAFRNEQNAEAMAKHYTEKGYEAFVQSIPKDKEMLHRVLIGKFENRKEAWKLAGEIAGKENVKAVVTGD